MGAFLPELPDMGKLSDLGSLFAVAISILALYLSQRGQHAQNVREKKEELRGVLERLVSLREEFNSLMKEPDEALRSSGSAFLNTKKAFYTEAAESIVRTIPNHVTASEYYVIALENQLESDFADAQTFYAEAARRANDSSPTRRSEINRALAWSYFGNPRFRNLDKGRAAYRAAADALAGLDDPYSMYTRSLGYRSWAEAELWIENRDEAWRLLALAHDEWLKIPTANAVGWISDFRQIGYDWMHVGALFFRAEPRTTETIARGREAFARSSSVFQSLSQAYGVSNDYRIDALGLLLQTQAQCEHAAGFAEEARGFLADAEKEFLRLPDAFPWKALRLAELAKSKSLMAGGRGPAPTLPVEVPQPADPLLRRPEPTPTMLGAAEVPTSSDRTAALQKSEASRLE
jgi:hypothetical protein